MGAGTATPTATESESGLPCEPQQGEELHADWSNLPADVVAAISKRLHDLFDFVYCRAVCKNWRTATSIADLPPQFPWLLEPHNDDEHMRVYSLISGKTRTIHCPKSYGMFLPGPSYGYLYGETESESESESDNGKICLLNLVTNGEMFFQFEKDFYGHGNLLCMSPNLDHIAFYDMLNYEKVGFYQPRTREWSYLESYHSNIIPWLRKTCFMGHYVLENELCYSVVTNIASRSCFSIPNPENLGMLDDSVYFLESAGKILRIVTPFECGLVPSNCNRSFNIYQLDVIDKENDQYRWFKISSIGKQILFLDRKSGTGISIAACETAGLRENNIYWLENCEWLENRFGKYPSNEVEVYRYNIEDGQIEKISPRFISGSTWFVPCIIDSLLVDS